MASGSQQRDCPDGSSETTGASPVLPPSKTTEIPEPSPNDCSGEEHETLHSNQTALDDAISALGSDDAWLKRKITELCGYFNRSNYNIVGNFMRMYHEMALIVREYEAKRERFLESNSLCMEDTLQLGTDYREPWDDLHKFLGIGYNTFDDMQQMI